jgi:hypothetical protein
MKASLALVLLLAAPAVFAQSIDEPARERRRAPLAGVEDLEPAVDVGRTRVAIATRAPVIAQAPEVDAPPQPAVTEATPGVLPGVLPGAPEPPPRAAAPANRVMDTLDLGTTSITGNAELPKVLYIVPWKRSDLGDLVGRPVNTLLDEVLAPVDPAVFERHLSYYESLHGESQKE